MTHREFAIDVVKRLQEAGFQALWAGGCVRDQLLGLAPKDYDVATNARPDQIRSLFGQRRTLAIGAAFGVITVLGPKTAGQIEVATFRRDTSYSDGRHPDAVEFTDAREDAMRRDFTINGMFFDPLRNHVIDYVGGQDDLDKRQVRAIGNPHERIEEDKLRMLRGIRFASTFAFQLEPETMSAIQEHAAEIHVVSEERIGGELVRMFSDPRCVTAAELLVESELFREIVPKAWSESSDWGIYPWQERIEELKRLRPATFAAVVTILFRDWLAAGETQNQKAQRDRRPDYQLQSAWRLTNEQRETIGWIANHWLSLVDAQTQKWSSVQPILSHHDAEQCVAVAEAIVGRTESIAFCHQRLAWTQEELDPPPLLVGKDLIELGIRPGPAFKPILQQTRAAQLDGLISTAAEAQQLANEIQASSSSRKY